MIRNYVISSIRSLLKHKFYSLINIVGLTIGLVCFLMISLFVIDEISYDEFHPDVERIYRMDFGGSINGNSFVTALAGPGTAETMVADFPQVVDAMRFRGGWERLIKDKDENINYKQDRVFWVDDNFFEFFNLPLMKGKSETVLSQPDAIVLSESVARKIYGEEDAVGKTLVLDNDETFQVTGIFRDFPPNMHFHCDVLLPMENREESKSKTWLSFNFNTYLKLSPQANADSLEAGFPALVDKYIGPEIEQVMGQTMDEFREAGNFGGFTLFPLKDIHLYSDKLGEIEPNGSIQYVYIFSAIALFILVLACINFMNLSTARSAGRAKEVGIRKVMGAYKQQLIGQFLSEAFLITFISICLAFAAAYLLLPAFNELANKEIDPGRLASPFFILVTLFVLIVVAFLAGSYPAFYLSQFKPVEVLKGKLNLGLKSSGIRSVLVVGQFTISIIMLIGTAFVYNQLNFIQNKKLGFNKDQILMIEDAWLLGTNLDAFKTEVLRSSDVQSGTIASFLPVNTTNNNNLWFKGKTAGSGENFVLHNYRIDQDYIETLGMEILKGRNFSRDFPNDSSGILINEAAARHMGFEDPVGQFLSTHTGSRDNLSSATYKIIGVVKDFHFATLRETIAPLIFTLDRARGFISFKINSGNLQRTISTIRSQWDDLAPGQPFEYSFLNDRFDNMYVAEQRIASIFSIFAGLAIFIACLGLYGLAAFTAEQKTKEIGIRKVLGASIVQIITLLSRETVRLVTISFILGGVISYFVMQSWLEDFVYRVDINDPVLFLVAGLTALLIAWLTMSLRTFKAARTNPVNSLKDE